MPVPVRDRIAKRIGSALTVSLPLTAVLIFVHFLTGGMLNAELRADPENYVLNRAAVAISMFLPFAILVALKQRHRLLYAVLLVFAAVSCFQSESSSAQLGVLVILLLIIPAFVWPRGIYRIVVCGVLLTFVLMPLIVGHVNGMIPQAVHDKVGYGSLTIRGLIWAEYANLLPEHVWLGYGVEASKAANKLPEAATYTPERKNFSLLGTVITLRYSSGLNLNSRRCACRRCACYAFADDRKLGGARAFCWHIDAGRRL
ncbi:O-antigen ligase family protein [Pannonibacter sp. Pt2-lr]